MVYRVFVERRPDYALEASRLCADLRANLLLDGLESVRIINRYDVEGIDEKTLSAAMKTVFSEPQTDNVSEDIDLSKDDFVYAVEYLPGQFDQRADSCEQCIALINNGIRPRVRTAVIYAVNGNITEKDVEKIKKYVINPVEAREAGFDKPETLADNFKAPETVDTLTGFSTCSEEELLSYLTNYSLAMDADDIRFCRKYFAEEEKRDPTISELRLIDSYWSDHCRHTTFLTKIENANIANDYIADTYNDYIEKRNELYIGRHKDITLMDIATIAGKYLSKTGQLKNLDVSEEINACSVRIKADVDGEMQDWLLMFKNETHNHPTEIEPFGGAATCLGGAIRDPLSGRAYVYQAMRVTGAADPRVPVADTMPGKLPQSKLTLGAAAGYSSYGNQIGLATGGVYELYHPNYVAKRLEIGAVVGAAPAANVVREVPQPGDVIILLGGKTGRDGCGGATGSSKAHTSDSLATCGAEVQKGNPPEERKIQRLFRRPEVTTLIKRCNDFGAGGVSVAIGELADGLTIDLSKVPKKYEGLDGTELAISESQERMAIVVSPSDADKFIEYANSENLEATIVAKVEAEPRLTMNWNGKTIISLSREFLNSNGAPKKTDVAVAEVDDENLLEGVGHDYLNKASNVGEAVRNVISDLNVCSKRGLAERFDASIGASTIVMPYGGKNQITPPRYMAAKLPVMGDTDTASYMAFGFDPYLSEKSPYHGAYYAIVESVARLVAAGIPYSDCYLTLQEYFERTKNKPERWGKPFAALLGAFRAQMELGLAAIGGKDSMSGSFEDIDVPPTLVSFAVAAGKASKAVTPEFKTAGSKVYLCMPEYNKNSLPIKESLIANFKYIHDLLESGKVISAYAVGCGGAVEAIAEMAIGNGIGFSFDNAADISLCFDRLYGAFVVETDEEIEGILLGNTNDSGKFVISDTEFDICDIQRMWEAPLEKVFPTKVKQTREAEPASFSYIERSNVYSSEKFAKPRIVIPVFPGTNCEYDTYRAFARVGGAPEIFVLRNYSAEALEESIEQFAKIIDNSQIFMLPGGFSGGDEPDGSGKFITAVLRNPRIKEAVTALLDERNGLALGICNGFQALLKSGLLPFGKIMDTMSPDDATLTYNTIGRHQSRMVHTRIASVKSPWLAGCEVGDIHVIPISHGEGRFAASAELIEKLAKNGQIATQYTTPDGIPTMDIDYNPNGSICAIEGITSPDGRIFGKMGHSERIGTNVFKNIPGEKDQKIFESGVKYFK